MNAWHRRHPLRRLAAAGLAAAGTSPALTVTPSPAADCFTTADDRRLSFQVIQQAPPPQAGRRYRYHPLTGVASMQLGTLGDAATAPYARYFFHWANRSNAELRNARGAVLPRKPNLQPGTARLRRQRTAFSSVAAANACTLAQAAALLGYPDRARIFAAAGGISLIGERQQPDIGATGPVDRCVLVDGTLPAGAGMLLDHEVQDGRSAAQTLEFLSAYAGLVHDAGRRAVLLVNPLNAPSQRYGGITPGNAARIVQMFDFTTIFLWGRNREGSVPASYAAQMALLRQGGPVDGRRLLIDFDLAGTSLADAQFVHAAIRRDGLAGVTLWRNGATQGGRCDTEVNRRIAALLFGRVGDAAAKDAN